MTMVKHLFVNCHSASCDLQITVTSKKAGIELQFQQEQHVCFSSLPDVLQNPDDLALKLLLPIHEVKLLVDHCRQRVEKCKEKKESTDSSGLRLTSNVLNITNANVHSCRCVLCVELKTKPNKVVQKVEPSKLNYRGVTLRRTCACCSIFQKVGKSLLHLTSFTIG